MFNRRRFLTASSAATLTTSQLLYGEFPQVAKAAPNERLQVGLVGTAGRAGALLRLFASRQDVDIVGIADIDERRLGAGKQVVSQIEGKEPRAVKDFRHLVDDPKIDILVVGTPDHWHAIPTIMACQAGKDVYVEKPDGHNMLEGQRMVQAMKKHNRVVQMGTQARSSGHFQKALELVKTGFLGNVFVAKAWESAKQGNIGRPADSDPPEWVDYDFWLGAAPKRPFNPRRFHGHWRWFFDYGSGDLGNDGVHRIDIARWLLSAAREAAGNPTLSNPDRIAAQGGKWHFDDIQEWPDTLHVNYQYDATEKSPGAILTYEMKIWAPYKYYGESEGVILYGEKAYMVVGNRNWTAYHPNGDVIAEGAGSNDGTEHVANFIDCVRSRTKPNADLETVGHPSSILCHSANVAWKLGRQVQLDPATELFIGDDEANKLRTREEYRKPWELPTI